MNARPPRALPALFFVLAAALALSSCSAVQTGADVLAAQGKISEADRDSLVRTTQALRSSFDDITEEEEYYIGRAVAANILSRYKPYDNAALTRYLNVMGTAIAYASDRPETYAGYRFLALDTDEVNAMAAPGGFVFVTTGLVKLCRDEETLAAILAHEIGHVAARHGLQSIRKSRLVDAFKVIGSEAAGRLDSAELTKLTTLFEGALGDVVATIVERGYDRKFEYEADALAVAISSSTGYSPAGLTDFLAAMDQTKPAGPATGWFKTHPSAADRLARARAAIDALASPPAKLDVRTARFAEAVKGMK